MVFMAAKSFGQDARVSQYHAIPMLVNPSQTGDFQGKMRILGLAARVNNVAMHNYIFNGSVDYRFGARSQWAVGLNYMQSGSDVFPVSGNYVGVSAARNFTLDNANLQQLRVGAQASYLSGTDHGSRGGYDRLLDVSAFRHLDRPLRNPTFNNTTSTFYFNYSIGTKYKIDLDRLKIETGFAAYNITNPDHNFSYQGVNTLLKRYRVTALSSIFYQFTPKDAVKVEHYSWKEGIFLRDFKKVRDTVEIHETTYSLTWLHKVRNNTISLGLYSRSWKAVYGMLGINLSDRLGISASYEAPILKTYYDVGHIELGLTFYPFKKKQEKREVVEERAHRQITGLMPFGATFCMPCLPPQPLKKPEDKKPVDTVAAAPVQPLLPLIPTQGNGLLYVDTIYYGLDKHNIRPDAQFKLNQISTLMKRLDLSLDVRSHTDLRASVAYNKKLSERRADAVRNYLVGLGVNSSKISTSWFGKAEPINNCITCIDSVQEKNRRSELVLNGFNQQNLELMLKEKFFGEEVTTMAQLEEKIKQTLALEGSIENTLIAGSTGAVAANKYYTIQVAALKANNETAVLDLKWLNMFSEKGKDGVRRYFYGVFINKDQAEKMLQKIKQLGVQDASIREVGLLLN
jgi:outer membrane protein OmpA-like peptidoglycan-associated protein